MTVWCLYKCYGYDDRGWVLAIYSTEDKAKIAMEKELLTDDCEGSFQMWILAEEVL